MHSFSNLSRLLVLLSPVWAQTTTTSFIEPNVPTGTPVPGNYSGPLRPQVHFSPPKDFLNDPNGLFLDANGTYHMYYQYDPTDIVGGNQHWGHATSDDLYHWLNQEIAIFPGAEGEAIFTGSIVIDVNNTSGFFPDQNNGIVAIYTLNTADLEVQDIAFSIDNGFTFTKYAGNPVISVNNANFRDPKVIWHDPTSLWVMTVSYAADHTVGFYTSPDLKVWTHASNFTAAAFASSTVECPNMVPVPMLVNASISSPLDPSNVASTLYVLNVGVNPGPVGGSNVVYFPGTFNGTHFLAIDADARPDNFAKDNYAAQFFYNIPATSAPISIAWASNTDYTNDVPTGPLEGWRSTMSLPRLNAFANITGAPYTLLSIPFPMEALFTTTAPLATGNLTTPLSLNFSTLVPSHALTFTATLTNIPTSPIGSVTFTLLASTTNETLVGTLSLSPNSTATFTIDRSHTLGFNETSFVGTFTQSYPIDADTQTLSMQVVFDRSIIEVFLDGGHYSATVLVYPLGELDVLTVEAEGVSDGVEMDVETWGLVGTWGEGIVLGNVTTNAG